MAFDQMEYIKKYNKNKYKMYQFRVKKEEQELIDYLDGLENKSSYLISLIHKDMNHAVLTIKDIKKSITPIMNDHGIHDIYLFGSYARGEANGSSNVDIYCEKGNINTLIEQENLIEKLEKVLNKKVDVVFDTTTIDDHIKKQMAEDMIKLCCG